MAISAEQALGAVRSYNPSAQQPLSVPKAAPKLVSQPNVLNDISRGYNAVDTATNKIPGVQKAKELGMAGLGVVGKVLSYPSELVEKGVVGAYNNAPKLFGGQVNNATSYEDIAKKSGVENELAQKALGVAGRFVLDPLNLVTFGGEGIAKIGLKGLEEGKNFTKLAGLANVADKAGDVRLTVEAGKELATLSTKIGRSAAEAEMLARIAKGGTNLIEKGGIGVKIPFTNIGKSFQLPDIGSKISPYIQKVVDKIPQGVKDAAFKVRQAVEYPLNRVAPEVSNIVDRYAAQKQGFLQLGDDFLKAYQSAKPEVRAVADAVLEGTSNIVKHENPVIQKAIEMRNTLDDLGKKAVELGFLKKETYEAGRGTYLPRLYDVFLQHGDEAAMGSTTAKKIVADEAGRLMSRTDTEIQRDLAAGKITPEMADAQMKAFERFRQAGGEVENAAFKAVKGVQGGGGFITKQQQFNELSKYGKTSSELATELLGGNVEATVQKGIKNTAEAEAERYTLDALGKAGAEGKNMTYDAAKKIGAQKLIENSSDVLRGGQKYIQLPESQALGALSGKFVPEGIHTFLTEGSGQFLSSTTGKWLILATNPFGFKTAKTVLTPGSQVRNVLSNQILNFLQDPGSFRHFREAIDVLRGGPLNPKFQEMEKVGLFTGGIVGEEVQRFYTKLGDLSKLDNPDLFSRISDLYKGAFNTMADIRSVTENHAKVQAYLRARALGATPEIAKGVAEKTIFAYNKVGPAIKIARASVVPFLTFSLKATPFIAEQAIRHPGRLAMFPKLEQGALNILGANEEEMKYLPDYMKGMIPLPIKDGNGNTIYYNPKYIYPWGNVIGVADFNPLPGLPFIGKGGQLPGGVSLAPTITEGFSQLGGRDLFTGEEFVRESQTPGQQMRARAEHAIKTFAPGPISSAIPFLPGAASTTSSQKTRGLGFAETGAMTGFQLQPFSQRDAIESRNKRAESIRRETTTEVNKAIKSGKSPEELRAIRMRGIERLRELMGAGQ